VRRSASEKMELIRLVERRDLPVRATLRQLGIPPGTFCGWYKRYLGSGFDALRDKRPLPRPRWNQVPKKVGAEVIDLALKKRELSARELDKPSAVRRSTYAMVAGCQRMRTMTIQ
jgi:putative transposase